MFSPDKDQLAGYCLTMTGIEIKEVIESRCNALKRHYRVITKRFRPEDIHRFRVEYKKLRAFLRLISFSQPNADPLKIGQGIKKRYSILGQIRDCQLELMRMHKISGDNKKFRKSYGRSLTRDITKLKVTFGNKSTAGMRKACHRLVELLSENGISRNQYENYQCCQWKKILAITSANDFSDTDIHNVRKYVKDLYYNTQTVEDFPGRAAGMQNEHLKARLDYFDRLLENLGKFQDRCTSIALFERRLSRSSDPKELELLQQHRSQLVEDKERMKDAIIETLYPFRRSSNSSRTLHGISNNPLS